jgi:diguanylate cyclase (GGDEF)-like protein/PAS domain S-box-containing protein
MALTPQSYASDNIHLLQDLLHAIPDGVMVVDQSGAIVLVNQPAEKLSGYTQQELQGEPLIRLIPLLSRDVHPGYCKSYFLDPHERQMGADMNLFLCRNDGTEIPVEINLGTAVIDGNIFAISTIRDITERKRLEEFLRASEARFRVLFQYAPLGSALTAADGSLLQTNTAFQELLGYSEAELESIKFSDYTFPDDLDTDWQQFQQMVAGEIEYYSLEKRFITKNGELIWGNLLISGLYNADGSFQAAIAMIENITERKTLESILKQQAATDPLTGLFNRRTFFEKTELEITRARRYNKPFSFMMFDLDHFKNINDTYGHHVGDKVLQALSEKIKGMLREIDIFGRIGGEEFAATLPETDAAEALQVATRIRQAIAELVVPAESGSVRFTASIGLATLEDQDASTEIIMRRADEALYEAKRSGRNRVVQV